MNVTQSLVTTLLTVHTTLSNTTTFDQVYLWAVNNDTQSREIDIYIGNSNSNNLIRTFIPPQDTPTIIVPGISLMGSATVQCYAPSAGSNIVIMGEVNRIDQA